MPRGTFVGSVAKIIDGVTIEVVRDSVVTRIRLKGIDVPEPDQASGTKSKQHLHELIGTSPVRVVDWGEDEYGQTLGDVYIDVGSNSVKWINFSMLNDGYAWRISSNPQLAEGEREARATRSGLWAGTGPIPLSNRRATEPQKK